jgi:hypothetical protein
MSGAQDGRICRLPDVLRQVEKPPTDGILTRDELEAAFQGDAADHLWTRRVVSYHYSEWAEFPSWQLALRNAPELAAKGQAGLREADELYNEQILPGVWLIEPVAQALGLQARMQVFTYHPVSFLRFLDGLLSTRDAKAAHRPTAHDVAVASTGGMTDLDDKDGRYARAKDDDPKAPKPSDLDLPDLQDGYGDP